MKYLKGLLVLTLGLTGCQLMDAIQGTTTPTEDGIVNEFTVNEASPSVGKPIGLTVKGDFYYKDCVFKKVAITVSDELKLVAVRVISERHSSDTNVNLIPYEASASFTVNSTGSYQIIGTVGDATSSVNVL